MELFTSTKLWWVVLFSTNKRGMYLAPKVKHRLIINDFTYSLCCMNFHRGFTWVYFDVYKIVQFRQKTLKPRQSVKQLFTLSSKRSGWKCFVNFREFTTIFFLKKTHTIFASLDEYAVSNLLNYGNYDWYCHIVFFGPIIIAFCSVKLNYF